MHAARGDAPHRLGRFDAAKAAFERAADLATTEQNQRFLWRRLLDLCLTAFSDHAGRAMIPCPGKDA